MNRCLGIFKGGTPCENERHPKRGDYCNSCYKNGRRPLCKGTLKSGEPCTSKCKKDGYCGDHKNAEVPRCIWIINEGKENERQCTYFQVHGEYCDDHYKRIRDRQIKKE